MNTRYIATRDLPEMVQSFLSSLGYGRAQIAIEIGTTFSAQSCANDGCRALFGLVEIATGRADHWRGSWGGANPFERKLPDVDSGTRALPPGFAAFNGTEGGGKPTWGYLTFHAADIAPLLPAPAAELSRDEQVVLLAVCSLKGGYRAGECSRYRVAYGPTAPAVLSLAAKGLLVVNKAGAIQATVSGRNARPKDFPREERRY